MSSAPSIPAKTVSDQRRAASPGRSAWVSANAGSGKTHVLVSRVIRLLLAGVPAGEILCLTFTKAAAAVMANRVFTQLGHWVTLTDSELAQQLAALSGEPALPAELRRARRLFAQAIETPGGLKIQTIHAFCERVLQLFPFEANVAARFTVLDEAQANALIEEAIAGIASGRSTDTAVLDAYVTIASTTNDETFRKALREMLAEPGYIASMLAEGTDAAGVLSDAVGIATAASEDGAMSAFIDDPATLAGFSDLADWLSKSNPTDQTAAAGLRAAGNLILAAAQRFELAERVFLTKEGKPRARFGAVKLRDGDPMRAECLDDLAAAFLRTRETLLAVQIRDRSLALLRVAGAVRAAYERAKSRRGALDFSDLIARTVALLERQDLQWVHFRLDRGVTHILVDEAQDTSHAQWRIFELLSTEFTVGDGQRAVPRTVFAVGDEKQSIYGFQGAAPRAFDAMRRNVERRHQAASLPFATVALTLSFRSTREVLSAVDQVFALPENRVGLSFDAAAAMMPHEALQQTRPGFVELWPVTEKIAVKPVENAWQHPLDAPDPGSPARRLAARIALGVAQMLRDGDRNGRALRPGDIMILVRRRNPLFHGIISALKAAGLPVAGADRLKLGSHIAVRDLVALGRAVLLREDDFSLACALKSPLFDLDDDALMSFAPKRRGTLSAALSEAAKTDAGLAAVQERLDWLRARAGDGPFGFYAAALEGGGGRRRFLARLGVEAGEVLDTFVAAALDHERNERATLTAFLDRFTRDEREIKRDLDQGSDEIRVMTVHAAKGLEAPVVILPDTTGMLTAAHDPALLPVVTPAGTRVLLWQIAAKDDTAVVAQARAACSALLEEEQQRLLYVAVTRARDGVIIAGASGSKLNERCWYARIERGLAASESNSGAQLVTVAANDGEGEVRRWLLARDSMAVASSLPIVRTAPEPVIPDWLHRQVRAESTPRPPIGPARASDAADGSERAQDTPRMLAARARGVLAHRLLEHLPGVEAERRAAFAERLAARFGADLDTATRASIVLEALALIARPDLADLFGAESQAEVAIAGTVTLPGGRRIEVSGRIDRIAALPDRVIVADYKTALTPPARSDAIAPSTLTQLALYRALVGDVFPDRPFVGLVAYTSGPVILRPSADALDRALAAIAVS